MGCAPQHSRQDQGYTDVPAKPEASGTIIEQPGLPVAGLWLMPDNTLPGMLENFIGFLVPPGDALWPRSKECLLQVMAADRRFAAMHRPKALIHTWLAWQEEPGTPLGLAITKHYLDAEAPHAQELIAWIRRLLELPSLASIEGIVHGAGQRGICTSAWENFRFHADRDAGRHRHHLGPSRDAVPGRSYRRGPRRIRRSVSRTCGRSGWRWRCTPRTTTTR